MAERPKYEPITDISIYQLGDPIKIGAGAIVLRNGAPDFFPQTDDEFYLLTRDVYKAERIGMVNLYKKEDPNTYLVLRKKGESWPLHGKRKK